MKAPATRRRKPSERGAALIMVIFASSLILLLLLLVHVMTANSGKLIIRQLQTRGQATSAASAGLTEALSWFVHQRQQPVTAFDPKSDPGGVCTHVPAHVPPIFESEEPARGIVRTFEIQGTARVWGRYEVRRSAVRDVSTQRGKAVAGSVWQLDSEGVVYVRNNAAKLPHESPNRVIARRTMRVDIQRLAMQLPASAAIFAPRGNWITVIRPSKLDGGTAGSGAAYRPSTSTPTGNGTIVGTPARITTNLPYSIDGIFGVTQSELLAMADIVVDDVSQLPDTLPDMALIVIRGNATFNGAKRLPGSGVLVVLGNLILTPQSNVFYNGLVWVGGSFTFQPPGIINGAVVVNQNVQVAGGAEPAFVNYDADMLDQIRLHMGNYLFSRSPWIVPTPLERAEEEK